ncbi:hypothetical protein F5Y18DRAFT_125834 [Xylariaceae sp. FL1019]|nr:hypothetical protein F5Y18DRAFT_125834 [Xylariaceae sp. FL1019]
MSLAGAARRLLRTWMPTMDLLQRESRRVDAPDADSASSAEVEIELWPIAGTHSLSFSSSYHHDDTFGDINSTNDEIAEPNKRSAIRTNSNHHSATVSPVRTSIRPTSRADSFDSILTTSSTSSSGESITSSTGIRNRGRRDTLSLTVLESRNREPPPRRGRTGSNASRNSSRSHPNRTRIDNTGEACWRQYWV